jgi:ATP-binding cassette, subfamily B, bacterial
MAMTSEPQAAEPDHGSPGQRWRRLQQRFPALGRLALSPPRRTVPFVQQLHGTECGAACLAMVLGFHGKEVSLESVRDLCPAGRDGVNAQSIIDGASRLGLSGRGVKLDLDQLSLLPAGATILHWEFQHFVVLARVAPRFVEIVDPAVGRRRLSLEEFGRAFTGVALIFERNDLFRPGKRTGVVIPAITRIVRESGLFPRIVVMSLALQVLGLTLPLLTGQVIDRVLPRGAQGLLWVLLAGLFVLVLFRALSQLVRGHLLMHLKAWLDARMSLGFLEHLVRLPFSFFQARTAGDLLMRLNSNSIIREQLTQGALSGLLDGSMVVVSLLILLLGSPAMATAAFIAGALDVGAFLITRRRQRELASQELEVEARSQGYEVELLTAIETLKASGCERRAVGRWSNLFVDQLNVGLARERLTIATAVVRDGLRAGAPLVVLAVGTIGVLSAELSLGSMLALAAIATRFLDPLSDLVQTLSSLETARAYLGRVNDVLQAAPEQPAEGLPPARPLAGEVALEHVSFRYQPEAPLAVNDVSLRIHPGQFVAIVGRSGSGKTTLAHLLTALYRPAAGRILFDGTELGELDLGSLRQQLGVVNQSFALFGATIRENICLADASLPMADVERAARLACIHEEIAAMPLGYNTPLGDRGGALSGGQRQRVALARALIRRPKLLLLDEATSALDAETERRVQAALEGLACTRVVIAHRLSTVRRADLILVMDGGRLVASGTHQSLLSEGGVYAELVAAQLEEAGALPAFSASRRAKKR